MVETVPLFIGREREVDLLSRLLKAPVAAVAIYGIGGIGKTAFLEAFAARARAKGNAVLSLDGRHIEPTERGFLYALRAVIGGEILTPSDAATRLGTLAAQVILII